MFFLKKILYLLTNGQSKAAAFADKLPERLGAYGAPASGRVVRTDGAAARGFAAERRGASGSSRCRSFQAAEKGEGEFAWYFAVRDFFARSASAGTEKNSGENRVCGMRNAIPPRPLASDAETARGCAAPRGNGGAVRAARVNFSRADRSRAQEHDAPLRGQKRRGGDIPQAEFPDELFLNLASLRGLNVEERMRGGEL